MPNVTMTLSFQEYYDCTVEEVAELPENFYELSEEEQCDIIDAEIEELQAAYIKTTWEVSNG